MKYFIQAVDSHKKPHAGFKALQDAYDIMLKAGYQPLRWRRRWPLHAMKYLAEKLFYRKLRKQLTPADYVLIQWPDYSVKYRRELYDVLKGRCHVQILVHDINTLREFGAGESLEGEFFRLAETLILHTPAMQEYVCSTFGVKQENTHVLTTFDYLTDGAVLPQREMSDTIVYAGNLTKSLFLQKIDRTILGEGTLNCYGKGAGTLGKGCQYKGIFSPDHVSVIEGSWGLVWDGDTPDTCSGKWGEYLRYNSPHKMSLYLASGMPVIIWKDSALTGYVLKKELGIAVNSLSEIPNRLKAISQEEYKRFVRNVNKEGNVLRNGGHLSSILSD